MYTIDTTLYKDMMIFHVRGSILLPDAIQFQEEIIELFSDKNAMEAVMDLSQVDKLDNSGLGVFINLSNKYNKQGRVISIYTPSAQVEQLIKDVGIEKFFSIYENEEELKNHSLRDNA